MEVKDKVKQRRLERLRNLRETTETSTGAGRTMKPYGKGEVSPAVRSTRREQGVPVYTDPEWNRLMEDPEFAWRHKLRMDPSLIGRDDIDEEQKSLFSPPTRRSIVIKLVISCALFAAMYGMFHVNHPLAVKGKQFVTASLTQSYDFSSLSAWYTERFGGSPSFIPSFHNRDGDEAVKVSTAKRTLFSPAKGSILSPYDGTSHLGVMLNTAENAPVYAMDTGQVIFAGVTTETGLTIVIRHANGLQSIYGRISEAHVEVNDWINRGEAVGKVTNSRTSNGTFYFAVTKDGHPMNPTEVITFD
ncbi:M23 family metallopeptidase [Paenibacillus sp. SYP-B3998]|uniref:M23 family metallopeptidase n=1 Tax=Paenibacillus sp. SYP-B3998 TaxID=2678564 RepID=A0A6G3ZR27_9BACL|nr:M23 family metallopeptidase [Paenibacillus sp. SYP-B3998]NEW04500.1 M23 family metallopeptidase [Paenibacillus sp. SYP-B3998]